MNNLVWKFFLASGFCTLMLSNPSPGRAAEETTAESSERLQRLETRLNQLAERQEQMMHRLGAQAQGREAMMQGAMPSSGPESFRGEMGSRFHGPMATKAL